MTKVRESGMVPCLPPKENDSTTPHLTNARALNIDHGRSTLPAEAQQKTGTRFQALYDFNPTEQKGLPFRAQSVLIVTGQEDRFTLIGYVEGIPNRVGTFPATYVNRMQKLEASPPATPAGKSTHWDPTRTPKRSALKSESSSRKPNRVKFNYEKEHFETYSGIEYDRSADFDPNASQMEWEKEEDEERRRQMEVRWETFERNMPPGQKCEERLKFELAEQERKLREEMERAERRRKFLEARAAKRREKEQEVLAEISGISSDMDQSINTSYISIGDTSVDEVEA